MIGQQKHPYLGNLNDSVPASGGVLNTFSDFTSPTLPVTPSPPADFSTDSSSCSSSLSFLDRVFVHITPHSFFGDRDGVRLISSLTSGHVDCLRDSTAPEQWTTMRHTKAHKVFVENSDSYLPPNLDVAFVSAILKIQEHILSAIKTYSFYKLPQCTFSHTAASIVITDLDCIQEQVDNILQSGAVPDYAVHIMLDIPFYGSYMHNNKEVPQSGLICVQYYRAPWRESAKWHRRSDIYTKEGCWFMAAPPKDKYRFKEPLSIELSTETRDIQPPAALTAAFISTQEPSKELSTAPTNGETLMQQNIERSDTFFASNGDSAVKETTPANPLDTSTSTATLGLGIDNADLHLFSSSDVVQCSITATSIHSSTRWRAPIDSLSFDDQLFRQYRTQRQRQESWSSNISHQGSQFSHGDPLTSGELTVPEDPPDNPLSSPAISSGNLEALYMTTPNPNQAPQASNDNDSAHQQSANNPCDPKRFYCKKEGCPKSYPRKANMEDHYLTHDTANRFVCPDCNSTFARDRDRGRHMNVVHEGWRWQCKFCLKRFTRLDTAKNHTCRVIKGRSTGFHWRQFLPNDYNNNDNDSSSNVNNNVTNNN